MFIWFIVYLANDNASLGAQVDDLSAQIAEAGERIAEQDAATACSRRLASEETLARFGNEIRWNEYALALGGVGNPNATQTEVLRWTEVMRQAEEKRKAYDADPVAFCATYR